MPKKRSNVPTDVPNNESKGKEKEKETPIFTTRPDGTMFVHIRRNMRNNVLSPTPDQVEEALLKDNCPIAIDLWKENPDKKHGKVEEDQLARYFQVFFNSLHRWKEIRLWADWVPPGSFQLLPSPLLESVELGGPASHDTLRVVQLLSACWMPVTINIQGQGPILLPSSLQKLIIRDRRKDSKISSVQASIAEFIPLKQLTTLVMENLMSGLECNFVLFELANNIVNCAFTNIIAPTGNQARGGYKLVTCTELKSLYFGNSVTDHGKRGRNALQQVLRHTIAHKLLALTLCHDDLINLEISNFIARSVCLLQALELHSIRLSPKEFYKILAQLPTLRVLKVFGDEKTRPQSFLEFACDGLTDRNPSQFTQISPDDRNILCPALEMILVNEHTISELRAGQIAHMIESRINRSPLKFAWIANKSDSPPRARKQLPVSTTLLSEEDLQNFAELKRDTFHWRALKYLIIDYDRSTYTGRWNRSEKWNNEVMATLGTLGPVKGDAKEPTVFEYPSDVCKSSSMAGQQQVLPPNQVSGFAPVGEGVIVRRNQTYDVVEDVVEQGPSGHNFASEQNAVGVFRTQEDDAEMEQMMKMALEASAAGNSIGTVYEMGMDGGWIQDPYQQVVQPQADPNDFRNIEWIDVPSSDHVSFNWDDAQHTM